MRRIQTKNPRLMKLSSRHHRRGFTLLELLVTMAIIAILAAMSFSGLGYVRRKQSDQQAKIQIELISKALEEYKLDNGQYPPSTSASGAGNTGALIVALYSAGAGSTPAGKIYLGELDPASNKQKWLVGNTIVDPWQQEYFYLRGDQAAANNPDFDLWSSGADKNNATTGDNISNF